MRYIKTIIIAIAASLLVIVIAGCGSPSPTPTGGKYYTKADITDIIEFPQYISQPAIPDDQIDKYPEEDFLFRNHCFAFYRDMDFYIRVPILRYDGIGSVVSEYPPQIVKTIENNGQRSMYFVYETDKNTRVFVFFFESDNYRFTRGYPIIMKKALYMKDFSSLSIGDSMKCVEEIDPITPFYRQGYDNLSDDMVEKIYVKGIESISSVHLLKDGAIRIDYNRAPDGDYTISKIISSHDFTIPVLAGSLCYRIYDADYIE